MSLTKIEKCGHSQSAAPEAVIGGLPHSQAGKGRHKCAVCAYQHGLETGLSTKGQEKAAIASEEGEMEACNHGNSAPVSMLKALPASQASTWRHKCVICAYHEGLIAGAAEAEQDGNQPPTHQRLDQESTPAQSVLKVAEAPARTQTARTRSASPRQPRNVDYQAEQRDNQDLGRAGEVLVVEHERQSLIAANRPDLAAQVKHVSKDEGDGTGYDIQSFTESGIPKYIEVKTTCSAASTPFFITSNEVSFSKEHRDHYHLYRVFNYRRDSSGNVSGQVYITIGCVEDGFNLEPLQYRVTR